MNDIPVGATWIATTFPEGYLGKFWLDKREGGIEIWKWEASHSDGSGTRFDLAKFQEESPRRMLSCSLFSLLQWYSPKIHS